MLTIKTYQDVNVSALCLLGLASKDYDSASNVSGILFQVVQATDCQVAN